MKKKLRIMPLKDYKGHVIREGSIVVWKNNTDGKWQMDTPRIVVWERASKGHKAAWLAKFPQCMGKWGGYLWDGVTSKYVKVIGHLDDAPYVRVLVKELSHCFDELHRRDRWRDFIH